MITDRLIERIIELQNPTCVGLDTSFDYLPDDMRAGAKDFSDVAERIFYFNKKLVDTLCDIVPSVKVQIAYYEMYGRAESVQGNALLRGGKGARRHRGRETQRHRLHGGLLFQGISGRNVRGGCAFFRFSLRLCDRQRLSRHGRNRAFRRRLQSGIKEFSCSSRPPIRRAGSSKISSSKTERPYTNTWAASWRNGEKAPWENTVIPRSARSWVRRTPKKRHG